MVELIVSSSDSGQRLNKYIMKYLNMAPSSFVYKMLRKKNIVLNDKKAKGDELLAQNDSVKLYLSDDTIAGFRTVKAGLNQKEQTKNKYSMELKNSAQASSKGLITPKLLNILYLDDDILAVHKPAGILSQKASEYDYSINECIIDYCILKGIINDKTLSTFKPSVCNRLDINTSGIILAGITLKGSRYLSDRLKDRTMDKYYFTIVKGIMESPHYCKGYIRKNRDINVSKVIDENEYSRIKAASDSVTEYVPIETEFSPISSSNGYTLLRIKLITGKSHQIRAHLKQLGYPIIGDSKYGQKNVNKYFSEQYGLKYQLLHSGMCVLDKNTVITDPLPEIFVRICRKEGLNYSDI